ncbi:MAG: hypothetical protein IJW44_03840 [Clostridia bacterium]|nr:hypothetical protein [Clostridia bacterium]
MKGKGSFKQRVAVGIVCVLIFTYTVYHLVSLFGEDISTFAAGVTTETTVLNYSGYVFRDETVLTSPSAGLVDYYVEDGVKVAKDQELATVYKSGTVSERESMRRLDAQIAVLEQSTSETVKGTDMGELKQDVSESYDALIKMLAAGETGGLAYQTEKLLVGMNRIRSLSEGEAAPGNTTLTELKEARADRIAESGVGVTYTAERSGYFYSQTDGYEPYFTMAAAESLTGESFADLLRTLPSVPTGATAYGKISYDSEWMLVLPVKLEEQSYFKVGETYSGLFEENNQTEIPLTLEKIVEVPEDGTALLIFRADRLPEHFIFSRQQNVRLEVDSVSGIYVPKDVVQRQEGEKGVYILRGSVVYFRYIEILHEGSDYYLVRADREDSEERTYLKVNDLIILNGKNMFDGRVLD